MGGESVLETQPQSHSSRAALLPKVVQTRPVAKAALNEFPRDVIVFEAKDVGSFSLGGGGSVGFQGPRQWETLKLPFILFDVMMGARGKYESQTLR